MVAAGSCAPETDPALLPDALEGLVEYFRSVAGEHPDWDEYRQAMVDDRRLVLRIHPSRAYGMA